MTDLLAQHAEDLRTHFGDRIDHVKVEFGELSLQVAPANLLEVCTELRDREEFAYLQLIDLCGVDYSQFGQGSCALEYRLNQL